MKKKMIVMLLMGVMVVNITACNKAGNNGMSNSELIVPKQTEDNVSNEEESQQNQEQTQSDENQEITAPYQCSEEFQKGNMEFATSLMKDCYSQEENVMISPVSVMAALSMTANGADGETLTQMEQVLGNGMNIDDLNQSLSGYLQGLPSSKDAKLSVANSIWLNNNGRLEVNDDFISRNMKTYQAEIYKSSFDNKTLEDINNWVSENTDGMIKDMLDQIPPDAIMYLINAVALDAKWESPYYEDDVVDQTFTAENGEEKQVPMMHSDENRYLEDDMATGFCKPYKEGYSFVALLPNEGITMQEYIDSLDGVSFQKLLDSEENIKVYATLPKFHAEYMVDMKDVLSKEGMPDAFDKDKSDFSKMGSCGDANIYINRVLHKTYIDVDEAGTKAAAATVVEMMCETAMMEETKTVVLDRPFVYAIIDNENKLPIFIGTVMEVSK